MRGTNNPSPRIVTRWRSVLSLAVEGAHPPWGSGEGQGLQTLGPPQKLSWATTWSMIDRPARLKGSPHMWHPGTVWLEAHPGKCAVKGRTMIHSFTGQTLCQAHARLCGYSAEKDSLDRHAA